MEKDIRIIKTKQAIEKAFFSLVESQGYQNVRLIDIAKKARINRNTIYLHYPSKEGIVETIISNRIMAQLPDFEPVKYIKLRNNRRKVENFYKAIFNIFNDNPSMYRNLLNDDSFRDLIIYEIKRIKKAIMPAFKPTNKNSVGVDMVLAGVFAVLLNHNSYAKENANENIKLLTDFTISNLRKLIYQM